MRSLCLDSIIIDVGFFLISFFLVYVFLHKCIKIEKELASNQILFTECFCYLLCCSSKFSCVFFFSCIKFLHGKSMKYDVILDETNQTK